MGLNVMAAFACREHSPDIYLGEIKAIATEVAYRAHEGQTRKDGKTPYILHPLRVSHLAETLNAGDWAIIAALWHDIEEDCGEIWTRAIQSTLVSMPIFRNKSMVLPMVHALTRNPKIKNRAEKNADMIQNAINGPPETMLVKMCDRIDNLCDSGALDDNFIKVYLNETDEMIQAFSEVIRPCDKEMKALDLLNSTCIQVKKLRFGGVS